MSKRKPQYAAQPSVAPILKLIRPGDTGANPNLTNGGFEARSGLSCHAQLMLA
jgi:hypothetical protein